MHWHHRPPYMHSLNRCKELGRCNRWLWRLSQDSLFFVFLFFVKLLSYAFRSYVISPCRNFLLIVCFLFDMFVSVWKASRNCSGATQDGSRTGLGKRRAAKCSAFSAFQFLEVAARPVPLLKRLSWS